MYLSYTKHHGSDRSRRCYWYYSTIAAVVLVFSFTCVTTTAVATAASQEQQQYVPKSYSVTRIEYHLPEVLDESNPNVVIVLPEEIIQNSSPGQQNVQKFPLLVFAHGFTGGNRNTYWFHKDLLRTIASYGFIVLAPKSCSYGCPRFGRWSTYDDEILHLLDWVMESKSIQQQPQDINNILSFVNHTIGYGIFGHSAGGQATVRALDTISKLRENSTASTAASKYNDVPITGLIMNIPRTDLDTIQIRNIPFAAFTGTRDRCCGESNTKPVYDTAVFNATKLYANFNNVGHAEPTQLGKNRYTLFIIAWMKLFTSYRNITMNQITGNNNNNTEDLDFKYYYDLIINDTNQNSICFRNTGTKPKTEECIVEL